MPLFSYVFSQNKTRNSILTEFVDKKETLFDYKNWLFQSPKNHIFPKGLTHAFGQKMEFFSLFVFGQKRTRNKVEWCPR